MAIKPASNTLDTIQVSGGKADKFDPDKMNAREWAVATDKKYVWMCFQPGFVLRMATYEGFEEDMKIIQQILKDCQDIQKAVEAFEKLAEAHKNQAEVWSNESKDWSALSKSWAVGGTGTRDGEDTDNSKYYSQQSKLHSEKAKQVSDDAVQAINNAFNSVNKGLPKFKINFDDGKLYHTPSRFTFIVNRETGNLDWGLTL